MTDLNELFDQAEAEAEAKPVPARAGNPLTPLISATWADYQANRQAIIDTLPRGRFSRIDSNLLKAATADLDAAYYAFLKTPEALAELAALAAYEDSLPDEVETQDQETDDEDDSDDEGEAE